MIRAISLIVKKINSDNFRMYASFLSMVFTASRMSLYDSNPQGVNDIRRDLCHRRRILNMLPVNVFTRTHDADYRDLNWNSRSAMMAFLW
jgi:hypothetical protein